MEAFKVYFDVDIVGKPTVEFLLDSLGKLYLKYKRDEYIIAFVNTLVNALLHW